MVREFHELLGRVEQGETVLIRKHGRAVARLVSNHGFISGKTAAGYFRSHRGDPETADAVRREIDKLDSETEDALGFVHKSVKRSE